MLPGKFSECERLLLIHMTIGPGEPARKFSLQAFTLVKNLECAVTQMRHGKL